MNDTTIDQGRHDYRGTRALVLGATGFIGRAVATALLEDGAHCIHVARDRARVAEMALPGEVVLFDLEQVEMIPELLAETRPEIVFNLAGYGVDRAEREPEPAWRVNHRLLCALGEALVAQPSVGWTGLRLVHAGSALEYGEIAGDLHERSRPRPTTLYGRSKLAGTLSIARLHRRHGLRAMTARLFTVYGPGEHPGRLLPALLESARSGAPLELTEGRQQRDFVYVGDVADGLLRLGRLAGEIPPVINLATGRLTSVRDFALRAARVLGIPPAALRFGALPTRREEMAHDPVSTRRLERLLGWRPGTTIEEGIERTARQEGVVAPDSRSDDMIEVSYPLPTEESLQ